MAALDARLGRFLDAVFWRYPDALGGTDLGRVDALRLHATAARVLGIDPAPGADPRPLDVDAGLAGAGEGR